MTRSSLLKWCMTAATLLVQLAVAQDYSPMWNQVQRWKHGVDPMPKNFSMPAPVGIPATMNPLSPPNTPDVQVFNPSNFWQSENSIGVNFSNATQLMVSTNGQIPGSNPVVQQPWAFSTDGGATWPASLQSESIPPGIVDCFGDPVAFFDRSGRAYYCTLGSPGGIYFVSTTNFGATWSARSNADNLSSTNDDKQHAAADYSNTFPNNVYTAWTDFGVTPNVVQFARSTNQGTSWLTRVPLGIGSDRGQGVHIAIGPNGEVYVIWADYTSGTAEVGIGMAKSTDGGATFNTPAVAFPINGTRISNGAVTQLNGTRTSSFPYADADRSNGPRRGWVYVVAPELDVALTGQSDIYIHRSSDGGSTWSGRIKVNGPDVDAGKWQFQASIAVDPTTGGISVSYFSMDSTGANFMANRYVAYSVDGGTTWDNFVVSDVRALWAIQGTPNTNTTYNGDYSEIAATNGKAWPVWQDRRLGAAGSNNRAFVQTVIYSENFGWIRGTVTSLGTANAVSGAAIDFVQSVLQQGGTTSGTGAYFAGAKVDTPATTANLTLRAKKFGFVDTTIAVTLTRNDTLTRNFQMRPAPGGTLSVQSHTAAGNLRSYVEVKFGTQVVISDSTNGTTGILSAPLPIGTYSVRVDAPPPYLTKNFAAVVINNGTTTNVDALTTAVLTFNPTSARDTLPVGGSHSKTVVMTNTSPDTVRFRITDDNALARMNRMIDMSLPSVKRSMQLQNSPVVGKGQPEVTSGAPVSVDGRGGPDAFGYSWIDSDEPPGPGVPTFNWFDISSIGTQITVMTSGTLDDGYATIAMPFAFPLYGTTYTSMNVGTNGFVNFGTGSTSLSNGAIPSTAVPNNALYAFWDDLDLRTSGKLLYYNDVANGRFVIQYDKAPRFGSTAVDTLTFQLLLKPNGEVTYQFLRVVGTVLNSGTIGVENATGTVALQVANNATYVHNNLAIRVFLPDAPWLSENPTLGAIPPTSTQNLVVSFDAAGLTPGTTYNANIFVDATHPDLTSPFQIPSSLRVSAADSAVMALKKSTVAFAATQINTTRRDTNWARNVGSLPLNISSITSNSARMVVTPASGTVAPNDSLRIVVAYTPTVVGTDTGRVIILSNSQGTPRRDVTMTGTGTGAPSITVSTATIADTLQIGQSHSKTFTITNSTPAPTTPLYVALTDSATWLTESPVADTLAGGQTKTFTENFNATGLAVGTYTTNIRITSNDPANPLKIVAATLRVTGGPVIATRPDSLSKTLTLGTTGVDSFYIKNTGLSALTWSLSETPGSSPDISKMELKYHPAQPALPKGQDYPQSDSPQDSSGGPDAFGYRWVDSRSSGGPIYNWIDISATGTALDSSSAWIPTGTFSPSDEGYYPLRLPFSFSYYGVAKDSVFIGTNGTVSFQRPTADAFTNAQFPTAGGALDNMIGPWWDDQEVVGTARVFYGTSGGSFVITYRDLRLYSGTHNGPANYTFQVILSPAGDIKLQYQAMGISAGTLVSSSIGQENATGTVGLGILYNGVPAGYMQNSLAILISRGVSWVDETPTSGSVNPGDSAKVRLDFNTVGLTGGTTYRGILSITSNDFAHNPKDFPVRLSVIGGPATVTVTAPNGGQNWAVGSVQQITWTQNQVDSIKIEYSTTGKTGPYILINAGVPARPSTWIHPKGLVRPIEGSTFDSDAGTYNWTVPNTPSANCFVRISRKSTGTPADTSDAAFTISASVPTGDTSWVVQPSGSTSTLYSVKAVSGSVVWIAGTAGVVLRTTNGGTNWTSVGGGAIGTADVYTLEAIDANTAFVSTSPAATFIYKTTNGGALWTQVYTLASPAFIDGIQMKTSTEGYAMGDPVGGKWMILKTTDGGNTWARMATEPTVGTEGGWNNSFQLLGNTMWFGTNSSKVYRSTDLGVTWTSAAATAASTYGVRFNSATLGMTGGDAGVTNRSTDGGGTWAAASAAGTGQVTGDGGVAGAEFWVTSGTNIFYTSDQGTAWSSAAKNGYTGAAALWALNMVSPAAGYTYGWAAGATGTILRYRRIPPASVANGENEIPTVFALDQNFPNPFNPTTTIRFSLPEQATVSLKIYNLLGQEVANLASGDMPAAFHNVVWNGRNQAGSQVASGMYFYRLEATGVSGGKFNSLKKLILLK